MTDYTSTIMLVPGKSGQILVSGGDGPPHWVTPDSGWLFVAICAAAAVSAMIAAIAAVLRWGKK